MPRDFRTEEERERIQKNLKILSWFLIANFIIWAVVTVAKLLLR